MHPVGDDERPVVEHGVRVRAVAAIGGFVEVLAHRQVGGEGGELIEEGDGTLEIHRQGAVVQGADAQRLRRQQPLVYRLGVLHRVEDEGVLGGVVRVQHQAPGEHEVMRRDGLAVAPQSVLAQFKDGAVRIDAPTFRHAGDQRVVLVVAQQPLHDMAEDDAAYLVRGAGAVQLRRLVPQQHGDGVVGGVHRSVGAAGRRSQVGQQVQAPHQRRQPGHRRKAEQPKLTHGRMVGCACLGGHGFSRRKAERLPGAWGRPRAAENRALELAALIVFMCPVCMTSRLLSKPAALPALAVIAMRFRLLQVKHWFKVA